MRLQPPRCWLYIDTAPTLLVHNIAGAYDHIVTDATPLTLVTTGPYNCSLMDLPYVINHARDTVLIMGCQHVGWCANA